MTKETAPDTEKEKLISPLVRWGSKKYKKSDVRITWLSGERGKPRVKKLNFILAQVAAAFCFSKIDAISSLSGVDRGSSVKLLEYDSAEKMF